jgi:hypothetical protein
VTSDHITISVELDFDMTPEEFFVDGVPKDWTIKDVVAHIRKYARSTTSLLREWCIEPGLEVYVVKKNPHYKQEEVLFEEHKPEPYTREREVVF